eukprot:748691-Hanusia_phi.AAC.1
MGSTTSPAALQLTRIQSGVRDNVIHTSDNSIAYPAGRHLCVYNSETKASEKEGKEGKEGGKRRRMVEGEGKTKEEEERGGARRVK